MAIKLKAWAKAVFTTYALVMGFSVIFAAWAFYANAPAPDHKMYGVWVLATLGFLTLGTVAIAAYILIAYSVLSQIRRAVLRRTKGDDTADGIVLIGTIAAWPSLIFILAGQPILMLVSAVLVICTFLAIWRITSKARAATV